MVWLRTWTKNREIKLLKNFHGNLHKFYEEPNYSFLISTLYFIGGKIKICEPSQNFVYVNFHLTHFIVQEQRRRVHFKKRDARHIKLKFIYTAHLKFMGYRN